MLHIAKPRLNQLPALLSKQTSFYLPVGLVGILRLEFGESAGEEHIKIKRFFNVAEFDDVGTDNLQDTVVVFGFQGENLLFDLEYFGILLFGFEHHFAEIDAEIFGDFIPKVALVQLTGEDANNHRRGIVILIG